MSPSVSLPHVGSGGGADGCSPDGANALCGDTLSSGANSRLSWTSGVIYQAVHACDLCSAVFASNRRLRMHQYKKHGDTLLARQYAGILHDCPACLRRYPTRVQCIRHMTYHLRCKDYSTVFPALPDETVQALEEEESRRVAELEKLGGFDCTALRSLPYISGPLRKEFAKCYAYRPLPIHDG